MSLTFSALALVVVAASPDPKLAERVKQLSAVERWEGEFSCPYSFEWSGQYIATVGPNRTPIDGVVRIDRKAQGSIVFERTNDPDSIAWVGRRVQLSGSRHDYKSSTPRGGTRMEEQVDADQLEPQEIDPSSDNPYGAYLMIDADAGTWTFECPWITLKGKAVTTVTTPGFAPQRLPEDSSSHLQVCRIENAPLDSGSGLGGTFRARADIAEPLLPVPLPEIACTVTLKPFGQKKNVQAKLDTTPAPRGELQTLSAESSLPRGKLKSFRWKFREGECPNGVRPKTVTKEGPKVQVRLLCPAFVELTVSDGVSEDTLVTQVAPAPRPWKTPFEHLEGERLLPEKPLTQVLYDPSKSRGLMNGGNVCGASESGKECEDGSHSLHPGKGNTSGYKTEASWNKRGYVLTQLVDPGGPFDGVWYVKEYKLEATRRTLMNPYILPAGKSLEGAKRNFYQANKAHGRDVDGMLAAIRGHEGLEAATMSGGRVAGHSGRQRDALRKQDPALELEKIVAPDEKQAEELADAAILEAELRICEASSDPINPMQWKGEMLAVCKGSGLYVPIGELTVGGPNYGESKSCRCWVLGGSACGPKLAPVTNVPPGQGQGSAPSQPMPEKAPPQLKSCAETAAAAGLPVTP